MKPDRLIRASRDAAVPMIACGVAVALSASHPAHASGFQIRENSAQDLGQAFAGAGATANDPAVAYDNPSAMVLLDGDQIALGQTIILPSARFSGSAADALGTPIAGAEHRDGGDRAVIPYAYLVHSVTPNLKLGLAVTSPFGLSTDYGAGWIGRYSAETSYLATIDLQPAIAYRLAPWLSVGAGISAQYAEADLSNALNSTVIGFGASGQLTPLPDGNSTVKGHDWAVGYTLGVLLQPTTTTRLALSYHSRTAHTLSGSAVFSVPYPLSASPYFASTRAKARVTLPDTGTISLSQQIAPRLTLLASVTWTDWSLFKTLTVSNAAGGVIGATQENWSNTYSVALGGVYQLSPRLAVRAGCAYDQTPVSDRYRTARVPDQSRTWLSIGASYHVTAAVTLDASYAHLFMPHARIDETSATGDVLAGSFSTNTNLIALGARAHF